MSQTSSSNDEIRTTERAGFSRRTCLSAQQRAAPLRWTVREGLEFLGIRLEPGCSALHTTVISRGSDPVTVPLIGPEDDTIVVRHTYRLKRLTAKEGA